MFHQRKSLGAGERLFALEVGSTISKTESLDPAHQACQWHTNGTSVFSVGIYLIISSLEHKNRGKGFVGYLIMVAAGNSMLDRINSWQHVPCENVFAFKIIPIEESLDNVHPGKNNNNKVLPRWKGSSQLFFCLLSIGGRKDRSRNECVSCLGRSHTSPRNASSCRAFALRLQWEFGANAFPLHIFIENTY